MITQFNISEADHRIRNRLALLKESFEPALLQDGEESLASFRQSFDELLRDSSKSKNEDTHRMVMAFAGIVSTISSELLEIEEASKLIFEKLEQDIARLANVEFKKLSIHERPEPGMFSLSLNSIALADYSC